jgi:drug/metabolite transporter (DMT)-like permease
MSDTIIKWLLFIVLCLIWGSSFFLMKEGLEQLNAYEVAALRIASAGVLLFPFFFRSYIQLNRKQRFYSMITGLLGSFFPAILFCVAETKVDSALAGMLNALTPLCVLLAGTLFFNIPLLRNKLTGVLTGLTGMLLLFFSGSTSHQDGNWGYVLLILIATLCYGFNVNIAGRHLQGVPAVAIASIAFTCLIPVSFLILWISGFFELPFRSAPVLHSIAASSVLGITGTAFATVLFYMLMKRAGPLFSSMVTYGIPFVAIGWGVWDGEQVSMMQLAGLLIILTGVFIANRERKSEI